MKKRVLITGGSGFIGKNASDILASRYDVFAPSHSELELTDSLRVDAYFKNNKFDFVIHCAAKAGHRFARETSDLLNINTRMFFNLVKNSHCFGKLISVGSGLVYGQDHYEPKMKEDYLGSHIPEDAAGFSKYIVSKHIERSDNVVDLRVFGVFGKYEEYAIRFISNAICKTLFDLPITIKQNRRLDYIYIDDLVRVLEYFMENANRHSAYNVTQDNSVELLTLAEKVRDISRKDLAILVAKDGMGVEYSGDNSRLKNELSGFEFTPMDNAIRNLYGWYAENKSNINRDLLLTDK